MFAGQRIVRTLYCGNFSSPVMTVRSRMSAVAMMVRKLGGTHHDGIVWGDGREAVCVGQIEKEFSGSAGKDDLVFLLKSREFPCGY